MTVKRRLHLSQNTNTNNSTKYVFQIYPQSSPLEIQFLHGKEKKKKKEEEGKPSEESNIVVEYLP